MLELADVPDAALLDDAPYLERLLRDAAERARLTVVSSEFHQFSPHGVTGVLLLAESHVSIHTWPEHAYAAVDVFACNDGGGDDPLYPLYRADPELAAQIIIEALRPGRHTLDVIARGIPALPQPGAPNEFEEDEVTVQLRERFEEFDEDGSGDYDKEEMMLFAQDSGVHDVSEEDIRMMLDMYDANGDGNMARAAAARARLPPHPRAAAAAAAPARF